MCQSCPASVIPIGSPFSMILERIPTSGIPGSWVPGQRGLDAAEAPGEVPERDRFEPLRREAQDAMAAEGQENGRELLIAHGLREVDAADRRPQDLSGRLDCRHAALLWLAGIIARRGRS